ncbi:hydrophobic/amphiphilic exporter-1, HAE1 family [Hydrocarboniphaga daqingensis]|uniref:Hydrophobic/amphiphilic exporter-1, HAE1 family n=1 Tax=Hydrocarboniphaga daqingensis TaxID=490188 RepID=A0A1M5LMT2_9GAMM|nr:efflux RND transporter permease subunit [Hydrocarboniphaga daqingensis]SHG66371.1 hydrophobic/amphiphilic exporter-1, HAE1 family [Hydrocarboniphaga daqingensis]
MLAFVTRRPVAVVMFTLAVLLFGMVSLSRLPVTLLPNLSYPTLTVRTELEGAAPTEIETLLSKPIEEVVGVIKNVRRVTSTSRAGTSDVTLEFNWGTRMDYAVLDVREKLDTLELPKDAKRPVVLRFDPSSDPILRMGLALKAQDETRSVVAEDVSLKRLRRIAEDLVQKPLEAVGGVAAVKISGGLEDEVQVLVDLHKLAQQGLTLESISTRLKAENVNLSGGRVEQGASRYLVRTLNQFRDLDQMRNVILVSRPTPGGVLQPVYLRDVAEVRSGYKEREAVIRIGGNEAVEIDVYKEGDGNTVETAQVVQKRLETLRKSLPADVELKPLYDQSVFIESAIDEVRDAAIIGGVLAVLIVYLFLGSAWITAVISISIPVSVIATFNVMYGAGLSLNIMSLGGIALAIGLVVDDAIVVLENIMRKREAGLAPADAAVAGASEVGGAVIASTLTTVAVFFPMVFVQGIAGQLFSDQALVVTGALIFSLVVSFTLIPMLAARGADKTPPPAAAPIRRDSGHMRHGLSAVRYGLFEQLPYAIGWVIVRVLRGIGWLLGFVFRPLSRGFQSMFDRFEARYERALIWALGHRTLVLGSAVAMLAGSAWLLTQIGVELIPPFNQGELRAEIELPPGTPLARSDAALRDLSRTLQADTEAAPWLGSNYSIAGQGNRLDVSADEGGENNGILNLSLKPGFYDKESDLIAKLQGPLEAVPGLTYRYTRPTLFTLKAPLEVEIAGYDLDALVRISEAIRNQMRASGYFSEIETTQAPGHPEIQIQFDQERAAALGLDTADLAARVVNSVQGDVATRYRLNDREIDVLVRGSEGDRSSVDDVRRLVINPDAARPVTLEAVADVRLRSGPSEIRRIGQSRVVVVSAQLARGDLSEAVAELDRIVASVPMPQNIGASVTGQSEEMEVSFKSLQFALALAVFLVYLVMASQFESLVHPFVILFTIPLAAIGAILALYLTGSIINVVALIGMIILAGIVVKNGIVLIDLVNRKREEGYSRFDAILIGGRTRLRPILMTTATAVLGLLPIAIGMGAGGEMQRPMAITVIGGLTVSTLLTLLVIPVLYTLLDRSPDRVTDSALAGVAADGHRA